MTYVLALAGLVTMAVFVVGTFGANLTYMNARLMLVNLLRTNPYQVEPVSRTMQGTFFEGIAAALKTGAMVGSRDPQVIAQGTRPAYDAAAGAAATKWKMIFGKAKLAAMAAGGSLALPVTSNKPIPLPIYFFALLTVAGLGWIWYRKNEVESAIIRARAEILPEVERTLIDGRYVAPPQGR